MWEVEIEVPLVVVIEGSRSAEEQGESGSDVTHLINITDTDGV